MKPIPRVFLCSWLICLSWFLPKGNAEKRTYMTYDMTSICKSHEDKFKIIMHHTGTGSTGILQATSYLAEEEEHRCMAVIRPPAGYGVVFNIEDVKLRRDANFDCRDFIKIYNETVDSSTVAPVCRECCRSRRTRPICTGRCGYEDDGVMCEQYCGQDNNTVQMGTGRSIKVKYHTRCGSCSSEKEQIGFRIVFTAYRILAATESCEWPLSFECDNGRCIWAGLTCDGHNNCGDMSDESMSGKSQCAGFPSPVKVAVVTSAVIATILVGVLLAYLPRLTLSTLCPKRKTNLKLRSRTLEWKPSTSQAVEEKVSQPTREKVSKPHKLNLGLTSTDKRLPDIHEHPLKESEV